MTITFDAIYENGVLVPAEPLKLAEHERVRVTVDRSPAPPTKKSPIIDAGRKRRIQLDEETVQAIANDPEFRLIGGE